MKTFWSLARGVRALWLAVEVSSIVPQTLPPPTFVVLAFTVPIRSDSVGSGSTTALLSLIICGRGEQHTVVSVSHIAHIFLYSACFSFFYKMYVEESDGKVSLRVDSALLVACPCHPHIVYACVTKRQKTSGTHLRDALRGRGVPEEIAR